MIDGAPNTQADARKGREAASLTAQNYLSSNDQIKSTAEKITKIIDSKPDGYFYPKEYFSGPGFLNFSSAVEAGQRAVFKANLVPVLTSFACGTTEREAGQKLQLKTSYGNWNAPGLSGFSSGQGDGSGDLIFQLLVANAMPPGECQSRPDGSLARNFDANAFI